MNNKRNIKVVFSITRIIVYIVIICTIVYLISNSKRYMCFWNERFGILCPSCGATRATLSIVKGDFTSALSYNLVYAISIFPLALLLIIDDILILILRILNKTKKSTLIETFFEIEGESK